MQLLTTTNVYDVEKDCSTDEFLTLVLHPPSGIHVLNGNAGLGADWPAGIWKSLNAAAIAVTIISAPSTIEENWPRWQAIYEAVTQKLLKVHGEYRVDRDTAQVLAMHHAVSSFGLNPSRMTVHMAIRHYFTTVAGYDDLLQTERVDLEWPDTDDRLTDAFSKGVRSNEEAARQATARYIFGLEDGVTCVTLVVDHGGNVILAESLNLNRDWG